MAEAPIEIHVRGEDSRGRVGVVVSTMPPHAPGPPLHVHDFDETFYVLDGELTVALGDRLVTAPRGAVAFAPSGTPHTLANRSDRAVRFLIVFTPAGFEREFARRQAARDGVAAPEWALAPVPEVTVVGPRIGERPDAER